jgi:hypothetical protein
MNWFFAAVGHWPEATGLRVATCQKNVHSSMCGHIAIPNIVNSSKGQINASELSNHHQLIVTIEMGVTNPSTYPLPGLYDQR